MFSALKKKALSRVEALKNLDSLCDDKQREAAAADAATAQLVAQMASETKSDQGGFSLPLSLPVTLPSMFNAANMPGKSTPTAAAGAGFTLPPAPPSPKHEPLRGLASVSPGLSSSQPSFRVDKPAPGPPLDLRRIRSSSRNSNASHSEADPFLADLLEAGLVRDEDTSGERGDAVLRVKDRPVVVPPPPAPHSVAPSASPSSASAPPLSQNGAPQTRLGAGWFATPLPAAVTSLWSSSSDDVKPAPVVIGPPPPVVKLGADSALAGLLVANAVPAIDGTKPDIATVTGVRDRRAEDSVGAVSGVAAGPEAEGADSLRSFFIGILWILQPLCSGISKSCGNAQATLAGWCCLCSAGSRCAAAAVSAVIAWCARANCNQRTIAAVLVVLVLLGLWRIGLTAFFVEETDGE